MNETGLISTVDLGTTNVIVRGGRDTFIIPVEVCRVEPVDSLQIVLPRENFYIDVDDEFILPISTKLGNELVEATYAYEIEDETCISIDKNIVKGLKSGSSKVVATAKYNNEEVRKGFVVTVY